MLDFLKIRLLTGKLNSSDYQKRLSAVEELRSLKDSQTVEPLTKALFDEKWEVRSLAAESLGELKDLRAPCCSVADRKP